jgi:hypothetical protein
MEALQALAAQGAAPKVAAFGHIHECAGVEPSHAACPGVVFVNCAMANDGMKARRIAKPFRVVDF